MFGMMFDVYKTLENAAIQLLFRRVNEMAKCEFCEKALVFGNNVSHSNRKTSRTWRPNIRKVKAVVNGTHKTVYVCSRCLRAGKVQRAV